MPLSLARRRLVLVSALIVLIGGLIGVLNPRRAAASTPTCSGSQLVETISPLSGGGTAGTIYYQLKFTNLGGTCELRGYPGVSAVSLSGKQMGQPAARQSGTQDNITLRAVTTSSAVTAVETIGFTDTSALTGCDQRLAAGLRIYAPGSTIAKYVPFIVDACTTDADVYMKIKPIS